MPLHPELDDGVLTVTIELPPNQLVGAELIGDLARLVDRLEGDADVRVAVFRSGDPDFFLMHADVERILQADYPDEPPTEPNAAVTLFDRIQRLPCATIGVLGGIARGGGCELLAAFDLRVGSTHALVGQPEVALGILPGAGGTVRWARALGRARALDLLLTGRDVGAQELFDLGWLQAVVTPEHLDDEAERLARRIARMPRPSIGAIKEVVDLALGSSDDAFLAESRALARLCGADAHVEPMRRFLAAGGQTREAERDGFQSLLARLLAE